MFKDFLTVLVPQLEHICELGYHGDTLAIVRPYHFALYSSCLTNSDHEASAICLASLWFLIIPATFKSSKQITWFSLISLVDNWCKKLVRESLILLCILATRTRALLRLLLPLVFYLSVVVLIVVYVGTSIMLLMV